MEKLNVSLPMCKKDFFVQLRHKIARNERDEAIEFMRIGYTNWMLAPSDENSVTLQELLSFPHEFLSPAVVEQMCEHGLMRSFSKFWSLIDCCKGQPWIYEIVLLVYAGLPYDPNPQETKHKIQSECGCIPDNVAADNRAKCWSYLDTHPLNPLQLRILRHKYYNVLHSNKNKALLSLLA